MLCKCYSFFRAWKSSGFPTCSSVSLTMIGIIICQATKEMPCVHPRIQIVQIFLWTLSIMIFLVYLYFDLTTQKHPKNYELRLIKRRKGKRNGRRINLLVQHYWSDREKKVGKYVIGMKPSWPQGHFVFVNTCAELRGAFYLSVKECCSTMLRSKGKYKFCRTVLH